MRGLSALVRRGHRTPPVRCTTRASCRTIPAAQRCRGAGAAGSLHPALDPQVPRALASRVERRPQGDETLGAQAARGELKLHGTDAPEQLPELARVALRAGTVRPAVGLFAGPLTALRRQLAEGCGGRGAEALEASGGEGALPDLIDVEGVELAGR